MSVISKKSFLNKADKQQSKWEQTDRKSVV